MGRAQNNTYAPFCFFKTVWYYRGNVVYIQPKEKEAQNNPWVFGAPGHPYGSPCPFPPSREREEEIGCLTAITVRLPSDQFRARGYKTTPTPFFLLKIKPNFGEKVRIGIVVGKSVHKTAVKRNFWKRQALAVLAAHAVTGSDILMIVSPGVNRLTKRQFQEELLKTLTKVQLK